MGSPLRVVVVPGVIGVDRAWPVIVTPDAILVVAELRVRSGVIGGYRGSVVFFDRGDRAGEAEGSPTSLTIEGLGVDWEAMGEVGGRTARVWFYRRPRSWGIVSGVEPYDPGIP